MFEWRNFLSLYSRHLEKKSVKKRERGLIRIGKYPSFPASVAALHGNKNFREAFFPGNDKAPGKSKSTRIDAYWVGRSQFIPPELFMILSTRLSGWMTHLAYAQRGRKRGIGRERALKLSEGEKRIFFASVGLFPLRVVRNDLFVLKISLPFANPCFSQF